jgi:hypothetical protein
VSDMLLWALGFFFLGVVGGMRLGVWWFTKVRPASALIDADVATLRAMPRREATLFDADGWLR